MIGAYAALAASMAMVGANVVVLKILAGHLPLFVILFLRTGLAALVILPFARPRLPGPRVLGNLVLQAGLGTVVYNALLLAGLQRAGAVQAGLVLATLPAVIALGAALLLRETLAGRQWLAVMLAGGGIAALAGGGGGFNFTGGVLVFGAVCGEAAYALLARKAAGALPLLQATFWMQAASAAFTLPFAAATVAQARFTPGILALLALHSLTSSLLAILLWYYGMRRVKAGIAGTFTALLPATATLCGVAILGEAFTRGDAIGLAALVASMLLLVQRRREPPCSRKASA
ncbi:MAG: DMT family transporter [Acidiphilium sp.]